MTKLKNNQNARVVCNLIHFVLTLQRIYKRKKCNFAVNYDMDNSRFHLSITSGII